MQLRSRKRKNYSENNYQISQTKKPKVEEVFPIETILQNPGLQLISRNIFKYLKLKDFSHCRLVSKFWKQFIDEDKYLTDVQFTEVKVMSVCYSKRTQLPVPLFHYVCGFASFRIVKMFLDNKLKWKIDVNAQDEIGVTPLFMACRYNNVLVVNHLLDRGLNVTRRTIHCN